MIETRRRFIAQIPYLPEEYQQVEYLGSASGNNSYIDTGVSVFSYFEIKFQATGSSGAWSSLMYASPSYAPIRQDPSNICDLDRKLLCTFDNEIHTYINRPNIKTFDGEDTVAGAIAKSEALTSNIKLFYSTSPYGNGMGARVYYLNLYVYELGVEKLVRQLVPCYRKVDNVAGMLDRVNNVFYTNAGTSNFIVGPDVS